MNTMLRLHPNATPLDLQDALIEEARVLAANTALLSSDAYEGFEELTDETKRTILFGIFRQAETIRKLAEELSSLKFGSRTDSATTVRKVAKATAP